MARSNTLPSHSTSPYKSSSITRSNTTKAEPKHHTHLPHPHLPHIHHKDRTSEDTYHESSSNPKRSTSLKHSSSTATKSRPAGGLTRQSSVHTRYMTMLLAQDTIPRFHTILAAFFTWVLLAGFLVFPGTFTSLQKLEAKEGDEVGGKVLAAVKNVKLIYIAAVCCGIGGGGMVWLVRTALILCRYSHFEIAVYCMTRIMNTLLIPPSVVSSPHQLRLAPQQDFPPRLSQLIRWPHLHLDRRLLAARLSLVHYSRDHCLCDGRSDVHYWSTVWII